ncbi:MAG: tetratricopeptide repeat protein [Pseudomonadota bacterium]
MRRRTLLTGAALATALLLAATPAAAQTAPAKAPDPVVAQAVALQAQGKPKAAYDLLAPLVGTRAGDPDFDYALGLAAADSGRSGVAIAAFQRVLAVQPNNAPARAEIARVYAMAGDIDTARAEFQTVVGDPTIPDPVRQRLGRLVRDYDQAIAGGGDAFDGFVDGEIGYDSNVNTATNLTSITLPVFAFLGPASLSGAATRNDDIYGQAQAGLSASTGLSRQTRGFVSVLGSYRDNFDSAGFDQGAVTGTAGLSHRTATGDSVSLSGQAQRFWLGQDGYRFSAGAIGQYTHRLSGGRALAGQLQYFRFNYDGDRLRDANRFAGTITYADRTAFAALGGGVEKTVRNGARNLGYAFAAGQLGTEYPVADTIALLAGASAEYRDYDASDPLFLKGRRDTQLDATLGLRFALGDGISVRPRATFTRNFSNIDLYQYSRVTGAVGLRLEF